MTAATPSSCTITASNHDNDDDDVARLLDPRDGLLRHLQPHLPDATWLFAYTTPTPTGVEDDDPDQEPRDESLLDFHPGSDVRIVRYMQRVLWLAQHPPPWSALQPVVYEWLLFVRTVLSYATEAQTTPMRSTQFPFHRPFPRDRLCTVEAIDASLFGEFARRQWMFVCTQPIPHLTGSNNIYGAVPDNDPLYTLLRRVWPHRCQIKHFRRRLRALLCRTTPASRLATEFACRAYVLFHVRGYRHAVPQDATGACYDADELRRLASWMDAWRSPRMASDFHAMIVRRQPEQFMDWVLGLREFMSYIVQAHAPFQDWLVQHTDWAAFTRLVREQCQAWRQGRLALDSPALLRVPAAQQCTLTVVSDFWSALARCFTSRLPTPTEDPFWVYQMARLYRHSYRFREYVHEASQPGFAADLVGDSSDGDAVREFVEAVAIPTTVVPHERERYVWSALIIYGIFERIQHIALDYRHGATILRELLTVHCGKRLSDTALHNRYVQGLRRLHELGPAAYSLVYSLCMGVTLHRQCTITYLPRSVTNLQHARLYERAGGDDQIITEASHFYLCPCCFQIRSMVQREPSRRVSFVPRPFTAKTVSGMQHTRIDVLTYKLYCNRKTGKKAGQCRSTALIAMPQLGILLHFFTRSYTLCVHCGILAEYKPPQMHDDGPLCGQCHRRYRTELALAQAQVSSSTTVPLLLQSPGKDESE